MHINSNGRAGSICRLGPFRSHETPIGVNIPPKHPFYHSKTQASLSNIKPSATFFPKLISLSHPPQNPSNSKDIIHQTTNPPQTKLPPCRHQPQVPLPSPSPPPYLPTHKANPQPRPLSDLTRQTPASIDPTTDMCRKWTLWHRGDHLDSVICCKLFPDRHPLRDADMARALGALHRPCLRMTGADVAELWRFLESHPDLHTNGIRLWQRIRAAGDRDRDDEAKVAIAIGRFLKEVPGAK